MEANYSPLISDVLEWLLDKKEDERLKELLEWGEDQPHLYGFIINLADDFDSKEHEALSFLPLILHQAFRKMGMTIDLISHEVVSTSINDHVETDNAATEDAEEELSHRMANELRKVWEILTGVEAGAYLEREDVKLVTRILVSAFEQSVPDKLQ